MSLPPALLARLKRRNIIQEVVEKNLEQSLGETSTADGGTADPKHEGHDDIKEEILAEDYSEESSNDEDVCGETEKSEEEDDNNGSNKSRERSAEPDRNELAETVSLATEGESVIGCPNKYNVYHTCERYCLENYGKLENTEPTLEQRKLLASLLKTFPLPDDWVVVFEPGVNTFYFWNIITNLVTWYPPAMNVFSSLSAKQIRRFIQQDMDGAQIVMPE